MSPKLKSPPWWQILGTGIAAGLLALGGGTGIAAAIDAVQGPDITPEPCTEYWKSIHDLKSSGFTGFALMSKSSEIAERCGAPQKVADAWPDAKTPAS